MSNIENIEKAERPLRIELLCNDGSPLGVIPPDIDSRGVGGAELSMMTLMEMFAKRGHLVKVFNDPRQTGEYGGVEYLPIRFFNARGNRDVLIIYRSPNARAAPILAGLRKVWWSTDQFTIGNFTELSKKVDFCVTISPYHTNYHIKHWNIDPNKIGHIDLGVRIWEYEDGRKEIEKIPGRMIYCSVPDRGLKILHAAWPLIKRDAPDATLVITSDYRLWGGAGAGNTQYRLDWAGMEGVIFYGKVPRAELVKMQLEAEVLSYPCTYEELFCISAAEAQVAGALPVTTHAGALRTTNEFGIRITGDPRNPAFVRDFANRCATLITSDRTFMETRRQSMIVAARRRFDWFTIAKQWEKLFLEGRI